MATNASARDAASLMARTSDVITGHARILAGELCQRQTWSVRMYKIFRIKQVLTRFCKTLQMTNGFALSNQGGYCTLLQRIFPAREM